MTLHSAVCAKCGKTCEVPFKPNGKKPVFCKDCFVREDAPQNRVDRPDHRDSAPRTDFTRPRPSYEDRPRPEYTAPKTSDETKKLVDALNIKIDGLIKSVDYVVSLVRTIQAQTAAETKEVAPVKKETKETSEKKPAKKVSKKK